MCLFVVFGYCSFFFAALFSKVLLFIFGGYSIPPFFLLPHFPPFSLLVFNVAHVLFLIFVTTMFLVFQGGSPMINGFSIVSKPPVFPLTFVFSIRGGGQICRFKRSFSQTPPPPQEPKKFLQASDPNPPPTSIRHT